MCGIAGVWSQTGIVHPENVVARLDAALAHRGPDGHADATGDEQRLLLTHRRLAIIDCSPAGRQPMTTVDGRHTIVFNGEIYNHGELRRSLEQSGERFMSRSDTEVLLRLVARRGPASLADVRGMFAFALWDAHDRTLLLARDRFGIKPLYVAVEPTRVVFASEIRALLDAGLCERVVDPAGVLAYLRWGSIPAPLTWVRGVSGLEPGTWAKWSAGFFCERGRFADVREIWVQKHDGVMPGEPELRDRTRAAVDAAVRAHLVADVPVGLFLSGGIDSGALVATAAAVRPRLHTFTVVVDEATHSEEKIAREVAQRFGTIHHTLRVDPARVLEDWPSIVEHMDQPTLDGINSYMVSSAVAATGVKAVISGLGGDEVFGGYPSFARVSRGARLGRVPRPLRCAAARVMSQRETPWRAQKVRHAAEHADSRFELYRAVRGWLMPDELGEIAGPALRSAAPGERVDEVEQLIAASAGEESVYGTIARLETSMYMRNQLLRDADVMSMAHGLEVRVPFVDHPLVSSVWPALGEHARLLARKRLLVEALGNELPHAVASRRKQGFTLPFERWLDGPLTGFIRDGLDRAARGGWIAPGAPATVLRDWHARSCHWSRPWGLAVLGHFLPNV